MTDQLDNRDDGRPTRRGFLGRAGAAAGAGMSLPALLAACGGGSNSASTTGGGGGSPKRGGRLRFADPGGGTTETLDPAISVNLIDEARDRQLYDTLTFFDPDWSVQNRLAQSLEPNRDASVWQLRLRRGVTFHNGKSFGADDVLYTWKRVLDPKTASGGAPAISNIDLARTKKVSDHEIRVVLKRPQVDLPALFSGREQSIVPDGFKDFSKPVGTGPFEYVSFTPGQQSVFKRNANYWVNGQPYVDELEMTSIPDAQTRLNALLGSQVDAIDGLPLVEAKSRANDSAINIVITKNTGACMPWCVQLDAAPYNKPQVVEALKLAVDRPKAIETALLGFGEVGNDLFGRGTQYYDSSIEQRTYDPEKAKALLKQAGVDNLKITLNSSPNYVTVGMLEASEAFASQAKAAGIDIGVKSWDSAKYTSDIYGQVPFYHTYWNYPPEIMFPEALAKGAPYNETHFTDARFAKLYAEAEATTDRAKRKEMYDQLQQILWDKGGYIIWCFIDFPDATSKRVNGLVKHPYFNLGAFQFRTWWLS